jgi:hypothetical protein
LTAARIGLYSASLVHPARIKQSASSAEAPQGIGSVQTLPGRHITIREDRIVEMSTADLRQELELNGEPRRRAGPGFGLD